MYIPIKTNEQINAMREWWKILKKIHEEIWVLVKPWISAMDLEKFAEKLIEKFWVKSSFKWYKGYPCILCVSPNEVVVHWIPSEKMILNDWDIVSIDCWIIHKWMHTDSCCTYFVWNVDSNLIHLSDTVKKALIKWIKLIKDWVHLWDIEEVIQKTIQQAGYCPIYDCTWHWVWVKLHEAPEILNYGKKWRWPILRSWMCLAIEPSATIWNQSRTYNKNKDKWTLVAKDQAICAQWEHTVLVKKDWVEILT